MAKEKRHIDALTKTGTEGPTYCDLNVENDVQQQLEEGNCTGKR